MRSSPSSSREKSPRKDVKIDANSSVEVTYSDHDSDQDDIPSFMDRELKDTFFKIKNKEKATKKAETKKEKNAKAKLRNTQ